MSIPLTNNDFFKNLKFQELRRETYSEKGNVTLWVQEATSRRSLHTVEHATTSDCGDSHLKNTLSPKIFYTDSTQSSGGPIQRVSGVQRSQFLHFFSQ